MATEDRLIYFDNVSKFYGEVLGVNRVSLAIEPGITSLVGPNGAGKTTLMNLMTGLLLPTKGTIRVLGIQSSDAERFYKQIGYCSQFDAFPKGLSGYQLIYSMLAVQGLEKAQADETALKVIERVGMTEAANRRIAGYSKGMRQRIKLALAIAHEPQVLVLDEPLNGLDPMARAEVTGLFRDLASKGMHVIISSHILHEVDMMSDRIIMMSNGYVVAEGDIQGVRSEMGDDHPIQILIRCDKPSVVAAHVFEQDSVVEVKIHADGQGLLVSTRNADSFYSLLNRIIIENQIGVEAVAPADENVHSVYQYLIGSNGELYDMNWQLWSRQIDAIIRLELSRYWLGRRWIGMYLLVLAPIALLLMRAIVGRNGESVQTLNIVYAVIFQFILRFAIFFSSMTIFSQLFRGEILEKTLHYYLLTPVRREVLALGKYMAGLIAAMIMFGFCTIATYLLLFLPSRAAAGFFTSGPGLPHLARYVAVAMLGCLGYGAVFLMVGLYTKNPIAPALGIMAWEFFNFVLPSALQKISVVHYLQSLCPVSPPKSPFAVLTEPTSPLISIPGLLIFTSCILVPVAFKIRRTEITYSAD